MSTERARRHWTAALVLGAGLLGGGTLAVDAGAATSAIQATPSAASQPAAADCAEDEDNGQEGERDTDDLQEENGADDAAEGDTGADSAEDEAAENDGEGENDQDDAGPGPDQQAECDDEEGTEGQPGVLDDGAALLGEATISLDEAIRAAQGAATGDLGEVDLERVDGTLVFNVDVGDQDVKVDAATGDVLSMDADD